ncbi:MAG: Fic family protein [Candidatus Nitrohelix vancouverensis]|uniref:Fic family protein n=1 Tax=Candidatus Nitrohelix vancouverensis TaxID=2705534 RepID=A0A7T0C167_9BACT|nr:MAG: Fic family protein [Candidatus Nitrohelix vancouverensis]
MKLPETPPDTVEILGSIGSDMPLLLKILDWDQSTDQKGRYLHWEDLKYKIPPPEGLSSEQWWAAVKNSRKKLSKNLPLLDKNQAPFHFVNTDAVQKELNWLAKNAAGNLSSPDSMMNPELRKTYHIRSLINEAINSSQLEGATTTTDAAKEMIRQEKKPTDHGEQMIFNNYHAMQFISEIKEEPLSPAIIFELHNKLTEQTLKNPESAGKLRQDRDNIVVADALDNTTLHVPPPAKELPERLQRLCDFANEEDGDTFIDPIIKAIVLHFAFAYDHPFVDGNGRTARALFYWYTSRQGYGLIQYTSISQILKKEPEQYKKAFLLSESDDNDLTYFILHQLSVLRKCLESLFEYLKKETEEIEQARKELEGKKHLAQRMNHRQINLLKHALKNPRYAYTVYGHQNTHGIAYETARKDLMEMADTYKMLVKKKKAHSYLFEAPANLRERIQKSRGRATPAG